MIFSNIDVVHFEIKRQFFTYYVKINDARLGYEIVMREPTVEGL